MTGRLLEDLIFLSATDLAKLVRRGDVSPVELTRAYLQRIEALDPVLNSYVTVLAEQALEAAKSAERSVIRKDTLPPFHGVPVALKDLTLTKGIRTTFSQKSYAHYVPDVDSYTAESIRQAGFIVLGKTNTPELGTVPVTESELNGDCRNPWNTDLTPGGSTGGGAAALAAGLCPIAQGSDGGGSIRIPASCCGLFGLKPSRGRISSGPLLGESVHGLATDGVITRSVRDAAGVLDILSGYKTGDPYWAPPPERPFAQEPGAGPGRLRIAFTTAAPTGSEVTADAVAAVEDAASLLADLGHEVTEEAPNWEGGDIVALFLAVWQTCSAPLPLPDQGVLEPFNKELADSAARTSSLDYVRAVAGLHRFARRVVRFWDRHDFLLTPATAMKAVPVGWLFEGQEEDPWTCFHKGVAFTPFTPIANLTGQPAASLPLYWTAGQDPLGAHVIGPPGGDTLVLRLAAQIEEARPWAGKRPPVGSRPSQKIRRR
ncbi:MAG TPA: amidase [Actinomycetota bacterium]|jgi:amidase|nr:amidase [Actinomycetota bacterium]